MMGVRKILDLFFDKNELKILDDILPEFKRHEKLDIEEEHGEPGTGGAGGASGAGAGGVGGGKEGDDDEMAKRRQSLRYTASSIEVPMANGNVMKIPISGDQSGSGGGASSDINISEEMNRSGLWKSLEGSSGNLESGADSKKKPSSSSGGSGGDKKRMSIVKEDEEDGGIQIKASRRRSRHSDSD